MLAVACTTGSPERIVEPRRRPVREQIDYVHYSFEVDAEFPGPAGDGPRDIDVVYRDMRTGNVEMARHVDDDWSLLFTRPNFGRGYMWARARAGGRIDCALEVHYADASGSTFYDSGARRCQILERLLYQGPVIPETPAPG